MSVVLSVTSSWRGITSTGSVFSSIKSEDGIQRSLKAPYQRMHAGKAGSRGTRDRNQTHTFPVPLLRTTILTTAIGSASLAQKFFMNCGESHCPGQITCCPATPWNFPLFFSLEVGISQFCPASLNHLYQSMQIHPTGRANTVCSTSKGDWEIKFL